MISDVRLSEEPLKPGETRYLQAYGDGPLAIEIRCFTRNPPPPGYKPCKECGAFRVGSGEAVEFTASQRVFEQGGWLEITIRDVDGDTRELRLAVAGRDHYRGTPAVAGA